MTVKDPRLIELKRQVRELKAARHARVEDGGRAEQLLLPDPIEFVLSDAYLAQRHLYPRQATLLKTIFLRDDLYTPYDLDVLGEWMRGFRTPNPPAPHARDRGWHFEGEEGIAPDTLERIALLKERGRLSFREVVVPIGRRGGKGHLGALAGAYVLWRVLALGDPHDVFEIPPGKTISMSVFAGNEAQARANQWLDLVDTIVNAPCFEPYIRKLRRDRLILATPAELDNPNRTGSGSIEIVARESTELAGRGPASFGLFFDEMAHVTASSSPVDADRLYTAATPALDQFRGYEFIYEGSSPTHKLGQFYINYQRGLEINPATGAARNPDVLVVQLPAWGPYYDHERAESLPTRPDGAATMGACSVPALFTPIRRPVQVYDDDMRHREADDPTKFAVERRAQWANVVDPYLNPGLIDAMFASYHDRTPTFSTRGMLSVDYIAHGDPATRHDRFAWVIGHREGPDSNGHYHAWVDVIRAWAPADFPNNEIDYLELQDYFLADIRMYVPYQVTFDQFSSVPIIQTLRQQIDQSNLPKRVTVDQRPHTHSGNQELAAIFRTALTLGLVHCPHDALADQELRFLQERNGRVDHPDSGPVTTNDVAISIMVLVRELIGYRNGFAIREALSNFSPSVSSGRPRPSDEPAHRALSDFARNRRQRRRVDPNPARPHRRRPGRY